MKNLRKWVTRHPVKTKRFLEILPGTVSWFLILFPVWGSFVIPEIVAYYIIAFSVYWFYRSMTTAALALLGYFKLKSFQAYDWMMDVKLFPDWKKIHHIIVIPTYMEPVSTLRRTLDHLASQTFPVKNLHIMMSYEDREGKAARDKANELIREYGHIFGDLWATYHPDLPGEVKGKSSNTSWGAKGAKHKLVDEQGVDIDYVTITSEDADVLMNHQYFACMTYHFLDDPERYNTIWQAVLMFYNNIWKVPMPVRVFSSVASIMQLHVVTRKDRLINFSTYSASLKMIDSIGYWDVDVIPEDWRLFFKAFFALGGKVKVEPIFLPIMADAAEAEGVLNTLRNQYEQVKRWAWGVSDTPYIVRKWIMSENVPFWEKTIRVLRVMEDHFLWPVNWFAITLGALLPPLLNKEFSRTIIGKTLPQVTSGILTLCLVALTVMLILNFRLRPKRDGRRIPIITPLWEVVEFVTLPIIGFFFTALPGVDAHTRLMLGKYIEYKVTEKVAPEGEGKTEIYGYPQGLVILYVNARVAPTSIDEGTTLFTVAVTLSTGYAKEVKQILRKAHTWCNAYEWPILLVGLVILARIPTLFTPHYYGDEEIYFVMGRAWREGVPMYQAMFDHKPPLLYILAGIANNIFWFRAMLMAAMVAHTLLFWKLARLFWAGLRPKLAYISSLIFVILTTIPTFEGNIANAELFMMLPVTLSLLIVWHAKQNEWGKYLIAGLIAGIGWLFKIPVVFDFMAIALYLFVFREKRLGASIKSIFTPSFVLLVVGFVLPLASTFAYYQLKGHGQAYLDTVLTVNLGYVSSWSTSAYQFNPFKSGLMVRAMVVAAYTLILYIFRNRLNKRFILASLWFTFSFFGSLLSGRPYPHYLHEPFVPLSLLVPFIFVLDTVLAWAIFALLLTWGVITAYVIGFWGYPTLPLYRDFVSVVTGKISMEDYRNTFADARRNYAVGTYLNDRLTATDGLFVWGSDASLYNITGKLPTGGKYIVDFHVHDLKKHDYVMANLVQNQPKFVVILPGSKEFPALYELLDNEYIPTYEAEGATVYKRQRP